MKKYSNRKKKDKLMVYTKQVYITSTDDITDAKEALLKQGYAYTKAEWEIDKILSSAVLHICFHDIHEGTEKRYSHMFDMEDVTNPEKRKRIETVCFESLINPQDRIMGVELEIERMEELDELERNADRDAPTELGQNNTILNP
tara:strand:+ start:79 stop:510 length:432 start_codon:yes stop_codon:yes gene_type:complete